MIIDTNNNVTTRLAAFKRAGVTSIGRYIASGLENEEKVIKPAEAKAIAAAGLRLFLIYEINGKPDGAADGKRDGEFALAWAKTLGAPKGAAIYYTVDYDASPADLMGIIEAFTAFKEALQGYYEVGCYGSGYICDQLDKRGLIKYRWLTMSEGFRGSRDAVAKGQYDMRQLIDRKVAGLDVDPDELHTAKADFGDFVPFALPSGATAIVQAPATSRAAGKAVDQKAFAITFVPPWWLDLVINFCRSFYR